MFPQLVMILMKLGFYVSATVLLPYSLCVFWYEYESFSRVPIALSVLLQCVLTFIVYFSSEIKFRFQASLKQSLIVALLLVVLGLGFLAIVSIIVFAYGCEIINHFRERRIGRRLSIRPAYGMACLSAIVLVVFPLQNAMYFRGTTAHYNHTDYNRQNYFYAINSDGFRGPPVSVKRSEKPRILFLGDSTAFGFPYRHREAYPHLVKTVLQDRGITAVESINAATIGQSIAQIRHQLPFCLSFQPDLVFIMTGIHYHRVDKAITRFRHDNTATRRTNRLPNCAPPMLLELGIFAALSSPLYRPFMRESQDVFEADLELFGQELRLTIEQIRAAGAVPFLIEYPTSGSDRDQAYLRRIKSRLHWFV